jgi:F-type H+-transporting ATPase subunit delta
VKSVSRRDVAQEVVRQLLAGTDQHTVMEQLAAYVIERKLTRQLDALLNDIASELQRQSGRTLAEVRTAFPLTDDSRAQLETFVKKTTQATSVEIEETQDTSLLGGFVLRTPDKEYDASLRHKLNQLARGAK